VLDDLGAERHTDWVEEFIYNIIDELYVNKKPLLVNTNLRIDGIINQVGERTFDRLIEMCRIIESDAPSYRVKIAMTRRQKEAVQA
jgi:DNA replication protein DnaC